jgi:predicted membrane protein
MRKFWIFMGILFLIVFGIAIACAIWHDSFRPWFIDSIGYIFGETGKTFTGWWTGIMETPFYLQWHPLIWVSATIIVIVVAVKAVWPRRPRLFQKTATPSSLASKISLQTEPAEPEQATSPIVKTEEPQKVEA